MIIMAGSLGILIQSVDFLKTKNFLKTLTFYSLYDYLGIALMVGLPISLKLNQ